MDGRLNWLQVGIYMQGELEDVGKYKEISPVLNSFIVPADRISVPSYRLMEGF